MKKTIAFLLALLLAIALALPAVAFPQTEDGAGNDESFGIAKGYVRTKEVFNDSEGNTCVIARSYNEQGKMLKEVESSKSRDDSYSVTTRCAYDKKGNLTKFIVYERDYKRKEVYSYNKVGQEIKRVWKTVYKDNTTFKITTFTTYNNAGKVAKERSYYDDCVDIRAFTYNKAGKPLKEVRTQSYEDNTLAQTTTTYTYAKNGNERKMVIVENDRFGGVDKRSYVSVYNDKNLCVKVIQKYLYTIDDRTERSSDVITYTYDKNGNVIKDVCKTTYEDGSKRTLVFCSTFDDNNRLIKHVSTEKSSDYPHKTTKVLTYDKKGKLVKEATVTKDDNGLEKSTETYTYDKAENLIEYVCSGSSGKSVKTFSYQRIGV